MYDVIALGSAFVDYFLEKDDVFLHHYGLNAEDDFTFAQKHINPETFLTNQHVLTKSPGGSSINTIAILQHVGMHTAYYGILGEDSERAVFKTTGVDLSHAIHKGTTSRCACILTHNRENRTFLTDVNPKDNEIFGAIDYSVLNNTRYIHIAPFGLDSLDTLDALSSVVQNLTGPRISIAPGSLYSQAGVKKLAPLLAVTDILFINQHELQLLTALDPQQGSAALLNTGPRIIVCTRGSNGSLVTTADEQFSVAAHHAAHIVDTTGAGDAYAAGFLSGLLTNQSLHACAARATATATKSLSDFGLHWLHHN